MHQSVRLCDWNPRDRCPVKNYTPKNTDFAYDRCEVIWEIHTCTALNIS